MQANLSNWREPEHSAWAFQNVDKIIATQPIKKGTNTKSFGHQTHDLADFKLQVADKPAINLQTFLSATETDGMVVLKDGNVVFEHYDRGNTAESKHIMMSMTKSVTGLVCGIMASQGKLDADALVTKYVPEVAETSYHNVTVRQCLDMRAGIKVRTHTCLENPLIEISSTTMRRPLIVRPLDGTQWKLERS
jgi:CubicO group peptidase (beta-lactamase class C family)